MLRRMHLTGMAVLLGCGLNATAAVPAFRPVDANYVVLSVGDSATQARLTKLREAAQASPADVDALTEYVSALIAQGRSTCIERYFGHAEAALVSSKSHAPQLDVLRAQLLQYRHEFDAAERLLGEVLATAPRDTTARLMRAQLRVQLAKATAARQDCIALTGLTDLLTSTTCLAQVRGLGNDLPRAYVLLTAVLQTQPGTPAARSWSAGIAAEFAVRLGDNQAAERWYREALRLDPQTHYPRIAYADWLLQTGRAAAAARVVQPGHSPADQLRAALATPDANSVESRQLQLAWREAQARGERGQLRDQARFELAVLRDATRAHRTALDNFTDRRDPEDALLLAATASATRDSAALQQVRGWRAQRAYQDVRLDRYLGVPR